MALPVAHAAAVIGFAKTRDLRVVGLLALVAVSPDLDFILVWGLDLPIALYHRTFSHSLFFALSAAIVYRILLPGLQQRFSAGLVLVASLSHSLVDMICTADAADHGVMLFWPFHQLRLGWPLVVPLYAWFSESPFSVEGAFRFTVLEIVLAPLYWGSAALIGAPVRKFLFFQPRSDGGVRNGS